MVCKLEGRNLNQKKTENFLLRWVRILRGWRLPCMGRSTWCMREVPPIAFNFFSCLCMSCVCLILDALFFLMSDRNAMKSRNEIWLRRFVARWWTDFKGCLGCSAYPLFLTGAVFSARTCKGTYSERSGLYSLNFRNLGIHSQHALRKCRSSLAF